MIHCTLYRAGKIHGIIIDLRSEGKAPQFICAGRTCCMIPNELRCTYALSAAADNRHGVMPGIPAFTSNWSFPLEQANHRAPSDPADGWQ